MCSGGGAAYAQNPANPASVGYVDEKAAFLQTQINNLPAAAPAVGSLFPNAQNPDGVVIYTDGNGHGIVAALMDAVDPSVSPGVPYTNALAILGPTARYPAFFTGTNTDIVNVSPPTPGNSHTILAHSTLCTSNTDCAAFAANTFTGGYLGHPGSDPVGTWYLPSENELMLVLNLDQMINLGIITAPLHYTQLATNTSAGSCSNNDFCAYWSSSENQLGTTLSRDYAYFVTTANNSFIASYNSNISTATKDNAFGVRAVHTFTY